MLIIGRKIGHCQHILGHFSTLMLAMAANSNSSKKLKLKLKGTGYRIVPLFQDC